MLEKFKKKLKVDKKEDESDWLKHKLQVEEDEEEKLVLAKDANLKNDAEWYEIHDPRNELNKKRREIDANLVERTKKSKKF